MNRFALLALLAGCATTPVAVDVPPAPTRDWKNPLETHFKSVRQLTFGGENAEAYWAFEGTRLSYQAHAEQNGCDRIYTMDIAKPAEAPTLISSGKGATTCAHFLPGGEELVYASTHLGGDACPPKPDMSKGYVWAIYDSYEIFKKNLKTGALTQLTNVKGYDAEATVCAKDGSIVFTSVRDGDIELYRMDKDGGNVKRLTFEPGYDGGAFFNADCSKLVWRASRPKAGKELDDYRTLLGEGLVRPTKLELYVGNPDGSEARQVTHLGVAAFGPFFFPKGDRILFSTNYPEAKGREFDIWAVNTDGSQLERVTWAKGFDGFPMFSPDGKYLAFSSNRATPEGKFDTNMFLAEWQDSPANVEVTSPADRVRADVEWLADPAREGRGIGTKGLADAARWLEGRFKSLGLQPVGDSYLQKFEVVTGVKATDATKAAIAGAVLKPEDFSAVGWSAQGSVKAPIVLAGYGIEDLANGLDDFKGLDVKGKIVVLRRFTPEGDKFATPLAQRLYGDLRRKVFAAKSHGAKAVMVVDWPANLETPEAPFPRLIPEGTGDAGIPVVLVKRDALKSVWPKLEKKARVEGSVAVGLEFSKTDAFNVVGVLPGGAGAPVLLGAHYDHLGLGGHNSLAPGKTEPHLGADDNASGVAGILEATRVLAEQKDRPQPIYVVAFSGEEDGVLGSSAFVQGNAALVGKLKAMLNLDMVGRLRSNQLSVLGSDSAQGWLPIIETACESARVSCASSGDGYGPSDQTSFYAAGIPVLHFFTGAHFDYHKPSDSADKVHSGGVAVVAQTVANVVSGLSSATLTYQKVAQPTGRGDMRSFGASLGTVPDYAGPPKGISGVLLADVRPGGGAEKAGMRKGDVLQKLGTKELSSVEDFMFVLQASKPGETVTAVVLRDGKAVSLEVTFQEGRRR